MQSLHVVTCVDLACVAWAGHDLKWLIRRTSTGVKNGVEVMLEEGAESKELIVPYGVCADMKEVVLGRVASAKDGALFETSMLLVSTNLFSWQ